MTRAAKPTPRREAEPRHPTAESLARLDEAARRIEPDDPSLAAWVAKYAQEHRSRLAHDLGLVERFAPQGSHLLEVGAVPLLATVALSEAGYRVTGVDVAPERFGSAIDQLGLTVARCDVEREPLPFEEGSFDLVLFNELFEHLRIDPIFTLSEVHRVLVPGGRLLLSTPNLRSLRGLKNLLLHNQGHAASGDVYEQWAKLERLGHMGHVREYTTREVVEFLGRIGFTAEHLIFRGGHGRGLVGLAERMAPSLRPFFSVVARRGEAP